jgi:hypothetical protein
MVKKSERFLCAITVIVLIVSTLMLVSIEHRANRNIKANIQDDQDDNVNTNNNIVYVGTSKLELHDEPVEYADVVYEMYNGEQLEILEYIDDPRDVNIITDRDYYWIKAKDLRTGNEGYTLLFYTCNEYPYDNNPPAQVVNDNGTIIYKYPGRQPLETATQGETFFARYFTIYKDEGWIRMSIFKNDSSVYGWVKEEDIRYIDIYEGEFD